MPLVHCDLGILQRGAGPGGIRLMYGRVLDPGSEEVWRIMRANAVAPTRRRRRAESALLWVGMNDLPPHRYLVASCRRRGETIRELHWDQPLNGERPLGREVTLGGRRAGREYPITVRVISPRLLAALARAPEGVIVCYEFGLVGLYAGMSKLLRPRRVVVLVEGHYKHLGRTGNTAPKVVLRRFAARLIDVFCGQQRACEALPRRHPEGA